MKNISELIISLNDKRRYFLNKNKTESLKKIEDTLNINFPNSIKEFYLFCNGGCIPDSLISKKKLNDGRFYEEIEWGSNSFLTLEDIVYYYNLNEEYSINFKNEECLNSKRLIPFFRTKEQEFLVFTETSLILLAKEIDNDQILWVEVYLNFEELLNEYIENNGEVILKIQ